MKILILKLESVHGTLNKLQLHYFWRVGMAQMTGQLG
jgi:hypothetical protein